MTTYRKGADPEAVARIASNLTAMQSELGRIESAAGSAMGVIQGNWGGGDLLALVRDFRATCVPGLQACGAVLDAMARRLDANVRAQRAASGGGGSGPGGAGGSGGSGGAGGSGGSGGSGGGSGPNDVTRTKGKKHDANPFRDYTHGWKDTEHGEHEYSSVGGFTQDRWTHTRDDSDKDLTAEEREAAQNHRRVEKDSWQVRDSEGNVIGHGWKVRAEGEHEWDSRKPLPSDDSDDPGAFANRHERASKLLDGGLGAVNWTEKHEVVDSSYETRYLDADGNPTDKEHAVSSTMGGTLGTETRHHSEVGIKDGALFAGAGAGAGAYLLRGAVEGNLGDHGRYSASGFVGAEAKADAGVSLGKDGLRAKAGAEAFAGARGEAAVAYDNGPLAGHASANAMAGAEAKADASLGIGKDGVNGHAGASAFAGAKAGAELGGSVAGVGGTVGGEVYAGIGGHANVDANLSAESVKVKVDVGAALGVGGGVKFSVDVQPKELIDDVGHGLGGAGGAIESGFKAGADSIGKVFGF